MTLPSWVLKLPPVRHRLKGQPLARSLAANNAAKLCSASLLAMIGASPEPGARQWGRPSAFEAAIAAAAGAAGFLGAAAVHHLLAIDPADEGSVAIASQSATTRWSTVLVAATSEEVLYRGFEFELAAGLVGPDYATVANTVSFAARHVRFFGARGVLAGLPATAALVGVYAWRRNLPLAMLTHFVLDAPLLLTDLRKELR